jgi:lipopolysaccharide/colanic/teichoic acid biosynthesis glycosyltransferase
MRTDRERFDRLKRLFDIAVAAVALVMTAPVQALLAVLVARRLGRPVLFRQERPGRNAKPFVLLKFRSMVPANEEAGLVTDEDRLTPFGSWLRSTSLDELPSLLNVLRGDMSLVGPRPLLVEYLPLYTETEARRHEVRPGLTGLAQVSGRNSVPWEDRFQLDVHYVDHRSIRLDAKILVTTLRAVVSRRGVTGADAVTMPRFTRGTGARDGHK